jgi:hypothetical protein
MTDAHTTAPQGHDLNVFYAEEVVPGPDIDVTRWQSWSYTDAGLEHYYVKGPCPACFAESQGHAADIPEPLEGQGTDVQDADSEKLARSAQIEVPVQCQCGFGHGKQDATSCGRSWSLVVQRTTS